MFSRRRTLPLLAAAALLVLPGVAEARRTSVVCSAAAVAAQPSVTSERDTVRATLCLLNQVRARHGLGRLRLNRRLSAAAERHSRDMVRQRYFAHDSLSGASFVDRIRRSGYLRSARSWTVGENLAWGSGRRATPAEIMQAWLDSPGHRENILTRFGEVGIGVVEGAPVDAGGLPAATYTTDFGLRAG